MLRVLHKAFLVDAAATMGCYAIISQPCRRYPVILFFTQMPQTLLLPMVTLAHWWLNLKPLRMFGLAVASAENTNTARGQWRRW